MSSAVHVPAATGQPLASRRLPAVSRQTRELVLGGTAVALAVGAFVVPLGADTLRRPGQFAVLVAWSTLSFVFAGLLWWRARPWSPIGAMLCALGVITGLASLQGSASGLGLGVGVLLDVPTALVAWYLVAAFPEGRLNRWGRALMGLAVTVVLFGFLPWLLFSPEIAGATPLARCTAACPENGLLVRTDPGLADVFGNVLEAGLVLFTFLLAATLIERYARASRPRRRTLLPVYLVSGAWLISFWALHLGIWLDASADLRYALGLAVTVARFALPLGFVAAIVLTRAHAGGALMTMVGELGLQPTTRSLAETVRRVLDDPSARLAFWRRDESRYRDVDGEPVAADAVAGASWREFTRGDGEPLVAIAHDPVLDTSPELVEAVGSAAVMALENRRLDETLHQSLEELRASRKRIVTAAAGERRRVERDLHDGSQQRLIGVQIQLELTRGRAAADPRTMDELAAMGRELELALDELRSLARGIYPSVLADWGLAAALEEAARRSAAPVVLELEQLPRYSDELEMAVYFACLEALQNVDKHAGRDATATVRLWLDGGRLRFEVADDGAGYLPGASGEGTGLTNIRDRLGAVGGSFRIAAAPGGGTVASGSVPV